MPDQPTERHATDTPTPEQVEAAAAFMTEPLRAGTLPTLDPGAEAARRLGVDVTRLGYPPITVVGSKGKGTTTIAASAALAAAGLCVGTVTSPSLVTPRERIRLDGTPLDEARYVDIAGDLADVYDTLRTEHPDWLLPGLGGRSLLAALRVFDDTRVDVAVLEASMGGHSDLTRIVGSPVVVITEVFAEHLGALGDTLAEIAVEKLGAITPTTDVVITVDQSQEVLDAWATSGLLNDVELIVVPRGPHGHHDQLLTDRNLELGRVAAQVWRDRYDPSNGPTTLPDTLRLPGRCQVLPDRVMVDCAISGTGAAAALQQYRTQFGTNPAHVWVMMPHSKDDRGVRDVLDGTGIGYTSIDMPHLAPHLRPDPDVWGTSVPVDDLDLAAGTDLLAFGTVSFAAAVLRARNADTATLW